MKIIITIFVLAFCSTEIFSQNKSLLSAEADFNVYRYFINSNRSENFNYGFSFILTQNIKKIKVSTGINYATKNSYLNIQPVLSDSMNRIDYKIKYLNFPVLITFNLYSFQKFDVKYVCGILFNKVVNYDIITHNVKKGSVTEKNIQAGQKTGASVRIGIVFENKMNHNFNINLSPFMDYKVKLDFNEQRPNYRNLTNERFSLGLRIGIEYMITKNNSSS